jgi:hypothetical protein
LEPTTTWAQAPCGRSRQKAQETPKRCGPTATSTEKQSPKMTEIPAWPGRATKNSRTAGLSAAEVETPCLVAQAVTTPALEQRVQQELSSSDGQKQKAPPEKPSPKSTPRKTIPLGHMLPLYTVKAASTADTKHNTKKGTPHVYGILMTGVCNNPNNKQHSCDNGREGWDKHASQCC